MKILLHHTYMYCCKTTNKMEHNQRQPKKRYIYSVVVILHNSPVVYEPDFEFWPFRARKRLKCGWRVGDGGVPQGDSSRGEIGLEPLHPPWER